MTHKIRIVTMSIYVCDITDCTCGNANKRTHPMTRPGSCVRLTDDNSTMSSKIKFVHQLEWQAEQFIKKITYYIIINIGFID